MKPTVVLVALVACGGAAGRPPQSGAAAPDTVECPPETRRDFGADSDVGWGEVEQRDGCALRDGALQGPAIEIVASTDRQPSTKLVGRYDHGRRVGTWTQYDAKTGAVLGRFTLDGAGSGVEEIRDQLGHSRRGAVASGEREGTWTYYDEKGVPVAHTIWSHGRFVRSVGRAPWDPPMVDPDDACPPEGHGGGVDDGCPTPLPP